MTYNVNEDSNDDGKPVALYALRMGNTRWLYTSADRDIAYGTDTFSAVGISDGGVSQGDRDEINLTCPASVPLVQLFRGTPPAVAVSLTVRRLHYGDTDGPIIWMGRVTDVKRNSDGTAMVRCDTQGVRAAGLRLTWGRACTHMLYDGGCTLNPLDFETEAEIATLGGVSFTATAAAGKADGYFSGGFLMWDLGDGTLDRRGIENHVGSTIAVLGTTDGLSVGLAVKLYPGCDLLGATCDDKFNNLVNHGGFEHMSGKSPFDGDPVF